MLKKITFLPFIFSLAFFSILNAQTTYQVDPVHTFINFSVERFMVGEVTGRFNQFEGTVIYNAEDLSQTKIDVTIKTESIDTGFGVRDGHLKGDTWLNAEKYSDIIFKSKKVTKEEDQLQITADITIHGVTKEIVFPLEVKGPFTDPTQSNTVGLSADLILNRQDFGISFSKKMGNDHLFIGNEVTINIRALAAVKK